MVRGSRKEKNVASADEKGRKASSDVEMWKHVLKASEPGRGCSRLLGKGHTMALERGFRASEREGGLTDPRSIYEL
jgi:hypothetical protein